MGWGYGFNCVSLLLISWAIQLEFNGFIPTKSAAAASSLGFSSRSVSLHQNPDSNHASRFRSTPGNTCGREGYDSSSKPWGLSSSDKWLDEGYGKEKQMDKRRKLSAFVAATLVAVVSHLWGSVRESNANPLTQMFGGGGGNGQGMGDFLEDPSKSNTGGPAIGDRRLRSILKVFCTHMEPSFTSPWQMRRPYESTSSAFVISGRRIITNAHGVAYHKMVQVRKHGDSTKYIAKVLHIVHESDLAVLTVEDTSFWNDIIPFEMDSVPNLQEKVTVIGYPQGGDKLSITEGIISRVDMARYAHSDVALLVIQIDAAINAGNSGGPALIGNKVVGVAFQAMVHAENIGYLVPTLLIERLLLDIDRNGRHTGFVSLGIWWQNIENPILQQSLGFETKVKLPLNGVTSSTKNRAIGSPRGILVRKVEPLYATAKALHPGDVLLRFDDREIASDGTVVFRGSERVSFAYLLLRKFVGEKARASVINDLDFDLESQKPLVPRYLFPENARPSYYVHCGLVFTVLTHPYLVSAFGISWEASPHTPLDILNIALTGSKETEDDQVVVLSHVLTSELTTGWNLHHMVLKTMNDQPVRNLKELYHKIEGAMKLTGAEAAEKILTFKFGQNNLTVVTNVAQAQLFGPMMLADNAIPSPASRDLLDSFPPSGLNSLEEIVDSNA